MICCARSRFHYTTIKRHYSRRISFRTQLRSSQAVRECSLPCAAYVDAAFREISVRLAVDIRDTDCPADQACTVDRCARSSFWRSEFGSLSALFLFVRTMPREQVSLQRNLQSPGFDSLHVLLPSAGIFQILLKTNAIATVPSRCRR